MRETSDGAEAKLRNSRSTLTGTFQQLMLQPRFPWLSASDNTMVRFQSQMKCANQSLKAEVRLMVGDELIGVNGERVLNYREIKSMADAAEMQSDELCEILGAQPVHGPRAVRETGKLTR